MRYIKKITEKKKLIFIVYSTPYIVGITVVPCGSERGLSVIRQWPFFGSVTHEKRKI